MFILARGIKAWIIALLILAGMIVVFLLIFQLFILLLPIVILLLLLGYFFRMLNKLKKVRKKDFIDVKHKVKK